jgi:hypothetical protein
MTKIAFILCAAAASFCTTIHAESLRCNGDLAQIGDSKASVLQKCGEPFFAESFCMRADQLFQSHASRNATTEYLPWCERVDEWSYNPGSGQFITILRFHAGALIFIRYGDRVK